MKDKIIIALDTDKPSEFEKLLHELKGHASWVKIGMQCFYSLGPDAVKAAKDCGFKVFVDLKLFDIPNTVTQGLKSLQRLGADMLNLHALGGSEMMAHAQDALEDSNTILLGVTQLTSREEMEVRQTMMSSLKLNESVLHLATLTQQAGLQGVVASAHEIEIIKNRLGPNFLVVTPGIRPLGVPSHDQKRVATPKEAFKLGADYIVIGRAITGASSPKESFIQICEDL